MLLHRDRAGAVMTDQGLDVLVATSPENVTYATGYENWTIYTFRDQEVYGIVPREGPIGLVVPIDAMDYLAEAPIEATALYTYGTFYTMRDPSAALSGEEARLAELRERTPHFENGASALARALHDLAAGAATVGLDERGMPPSRWRHLASALTGRTLVEAHETFRRIRMVKTSDEIERLRTVALGVEAAMLAAFRAAEPGVAEAALDQTFREAAIARGVTPGHFETTAGSRSAGSFPASSTYRLKTGDVIRADVGGRRRGYWADTGRVASVGAPPAKLAGYHDVLRRGIDAILELVRPGATPAELFRAGVGAVRAGGIPHYERHHVGHAIGLEFYERPILNAAAGTPDEPSVRLEVGMVLNVELPYYELGLGGLQIEETLVVRPGGYELLTSAQRGIIRAGGREPAGRRTSHGSGA